MHLVTIYTKRQFRDLGHNKSGKYYLPIIPNLTKLVRKSGLLSNLIFMAIMEPYTAQFQRCHPSVPMLRYRSNVIDDLSAMKIIYYDDAALMVKDGHA